MLSRWCWMMNAAARPAPAGHEDISRGVFDEHHLAREEVLEVEGLVLVPVHPLLLGEHDVEADGEPLAALGSPVRRLHYAAAPAGDDGVPLSREGFRHLAGVPVGPVLPPGPCAAEDGDGRADVAEGFEPLHELAHEADNTPR